MTSRKLRHYFQEHKIIVVSTAPIRDIINNKVGKYLGLDYCTRLVLNVESYKLYYPLCDTSCSVAVVDYISQRSRAHYCDLVLLKISA